MITHEPLMSRPDLKRAKRNSLVLAESMRVLRCDRQAVPVKIEAMVAELAELRRLLAEGVIK